MAGRAWFPVVWLVSIPLLSGLLGLYGFWDLSLPSLGVVALCFACELLDSSVGMGYGTTLTPVLLTFGYEPLQLVPTVLLSELLSGLAASFFHSRAGNVDFSRDSPHRRVAWVLSLASLLGVALGVYLALQVSGQTLKLIIGFVILLAGVYIWIRIQHPLPYRRWRLILLAGVASFNKAISGGGYGPLMTSGQILSGVESKAAVAITSLAEAFTCFAAVLLFLGKGKLLTPELLIPVVTGALLSVPVSARLVRGIPENRLKVLVASLTILLGAFTLYRAL